MPPTMITISSAAASAPAVMPRIVPGGRRAAPVRVPFRRPADSTATRINPAAITSAGSSPAMNSPAIDTFAT